MARDSGSLSDDTYIQAVYRHTSAHGVHSYPLNTALGTMIFMQPLQGLHTF